MAAKPLPAIFFFLIVSVAVTKEEQWQTRPTKSQQFQLQKLKTSQPSKRLELEGGVIELWDENEDQFHCAGVAPAKITLQPSSLSLPRYHDAPHLIYIGQGSGLVGVSLPGCARTLQSQKDSWSSKHKEEKQEQQQEPRRQGRGDQHQMLQRVQKGDIVAFPAGAFNWCFNHGNEELIFIVVAHLHNVTNQLDHKFRSFYPVGVPSQGKRGKQAQEGQDTFQKILHAFDENLLAEAFHVPIEVIRAMQKEDKGKLIVRVETGMSRTRPYKGKAKEQEQEEQRGGSGIEETLCTMKIVANIDSREYAEVFSKQAGRLNVVNKIKLPILSLLDMSAEKGNLYPNALYTPHWSTNGHTIVYVTEGEAQVQVVGHNGETVMDERVKESDMFVVPRYFSSMAKAGENGFEWVSIETTRKALKNPLAGYTSFSRAMPLPVISNSYRISPIEPQDLNLNRGQQTLLLSRDKTSS